jgi:hypothetical protein
MDTGDLVYFRDYNATILPRPTNVDENTPVPAQLGAQDLANDPVGGEVAYSVNGRVARGHDKDKQETKKKWQAIQKRGAALLSQSQQFSVAVAGGFAAGKIRPTDVEVQGLLEEAASLQMYVDTPGESFADGLRAQLGELTKVCLAFSLPCCIQ